MNSMMIVIEELKVTMFILPDRITIIALGKIEALDGGAECCELQLWDPQDIV